MEHFRWMIVVVWFLGLFYPFSVVQAESQKIEVTSKESKTYSLQDLLKLAWRRNPLLQAARYKIAAAKARQNEVFWTSWGVQGQMLALLLPSPSAKGNAVTSSTPFPSSYFRFREYGVLTRVELSLAWPLYTFGKLTFAQTAAKEGVQVETARVRLEKNKLRGLIEKAYYGALLAESGLVLLEEGEGYLENARKKASSKTDKLKIRVFESQLKARLEQAKTGKRLGLSALKRLSGLDMNKILVTKQRELEEPKAFSFRPLESYLQLARKHRPELQMLSHGLKARNALVSLQKRTLFPDFIIGGFFRYAYSNSAEDQLSPFAKDDFNYIEGGLGLGLRFTFDIPQKLARIRRAQAQRSSLVYTRKFAIQGIMLQVEKAYREWRSAARLIKLLKIGQKAANKWMTKTAISYSSGFSDLRELTEALTASSQTRFGYLDAIHKFYLAQSRLSKAVGIDIALK